MPPAVGVDAQDRSIGHVSAREPVNLARTLSGNKLPGKMVNGRISVIKIRETGEN